MIVVFDCLVKRGRHLRISALVNSYSITAPADICDRLWDFGPYGGTWAKLGFLYNLKCSSVLGILVKF